MQIFNLLRSRHFLLIVFTFCSLQHTSAQKYPRYNPSPSFINAGPVQLGLKASYLMPRNEFGMDFKRTPAYEIYCQFRNKDGDGKWAARVGLFYADPKPRLDTIPSYIVQEPSTKLFPGYIVYKKLRFMGIGMDYAYSAVHYHNFRMDIGLGLLVGQYHQEYAQGYATISRSDGNTDSYFAGLRGRVTAGSQLSKYVEAYIEALDAIVTKTDWNSQFSHTSLSLGINISFKPSDNDN